MSRYTLPLVSRVRFSSCGILVLSFSASSSAPCSCFVFARVFTCLWPFIYASLCVRVLAGLVCGQKCGTTHFFIKDKRVLQQTPTEILISSAVECFALSCEFLSRLNSSRCSIMEQYRPYLESDVKSNKFSSVSIVWYEYRSNPAALSPTAYIRLHHYSTLLPDNSDLRLDMNVIMGWFIQCPPQPRPKLLQYPSFPA